MRISRPFAVLIPFITLMNLSGCLTSPKQNEDPIPGLRRYSVAYTARDGWLMRRTLRRIEPSCNGSTLVYDTLRGSADSIAYSLSGDTLDWYYRPDSSFPGVTVQDFLRFGRVGPGSGLSGIWLSAHQRYRVVSGDLSARNKAFLDSNLDISNRESGYTTTHLRFTPDSLELYSQTDYAGLALVSWTNAIPVNEGPDSARWDMDFRILDRNTVEYHGRKSGETVRVARFDNDDMDYTSDDPSHPPYRYRALPDSCPDEFEPDWYQFFRMANAKARPALLKAQIRLNSLTKRDEASAPLKFAPFFLN